MKLEAELREGLRVVAAGWVRAVTWKVGSACENRNPDSRCPMHKYH